MNLRFIFFLFLIFSFSLLPAQNRWIYAKGSQAGTFSEGNAVTADVYGNVYETGGYQNSLSTGNVTVTNGGNYSYYLFKYDSSGNALWGRTCIDTDISNGIAVAVDLLGNVYVSGYFQGPSIVFASDTLFNSNSNPNANDLFLVKYNSSGVEQWARNATSDQLGFGSDNGLAIDPTGNIYVCGNFNGTFLISGNDTLFNSGSGASYLLKFDANGNSLWAKSSIGQIKAGASGVSADHFGNIFLTGYCRGEIVIFGLDTLFPADTSQYGIFLTKYDSNGNVKWAKGKFPAHNFYSIDISTDLDGNPFICGFFTDSILVFASDTLYCDQTNAGANICLAKYDTAGTELWARSPRTSNEIMGYSISTSRKNNVYLAGGGPHLISALPFIVFGTDTLFYPSWTVDFAFIAKYDENGNFLCADYLQSGGDDQLSVFADPLRDDAYLGGDFLGNVNVLLDTIQVTGSGGEYSFLAKWKCDNTVGLQEIVRDNLSATVFPDPAVNSVNLNFSSDGKSKVTISILNTSGEIVRKIPIHENTPGEQSILIDLHDLSAGIYLCKIETSSGDEAHVLIIKSN